MNFVVGQIINFGFVLLIAGLVSACSRASDSDGVHQAPHVPAKKAKIEPGMGLSFICPDSFNKTTVTLISAWDANTQHWLVFLDEFDGQGNQVLKLDNLVGTPDKIESLQMNITFNLAEYAKIIQIDQSQAQYRDSSRTLVCSFQ